MTRVLAGRLALAAALLGGVAFALTHRALFAPDALLARVEALGPWGPVVFVLAYALGALLFLPGSALTVAGGALFGPILGTLYSTLGATLGATGAFVVARYLAGDGVRKRAGPRLDPLLQGVEEEGWRFVAFTRLVPIFPFNLLNYALGLTRIRLLPYVLASAVAMVPGTAAYTWIGHAGRQAASGQGSAIRSALVALALLAGVAFLVPRLLGRLRSTKTPSVTPPAP